MKIDIITLFPEMFKGPFDESIIKRASEKGLVEIETHDLRKWAKDKHKTVDDRPYSGGTGMILMVEPIYNALSDISKWEMGGEKVENEVGNEKKLSHIPPQIPTSYLPHPTSTSRIILLDPGGKPFTQRKAEELSNLDHLILLAAHYEGVDHRVREHLVDEEISIGDYILTGGELPAMVLVDAITRLIPGVLEKPEATQFESFSSQLENGKCPSRRRRQVEAGKMENLLEYPQYTRPENFKSWGVPEILLSGNHKQIEKWRLEQAVKRTKKNRSDLLKKT